MAIFFEEECVFRGIPYRLQVHGDFSNPTFVVSPLSDRSITSLTNPLCEQLIEKLDAHCPHDQKGNAYPDAGRRVASIQWFEQKLDGNFDKVSFRSFGKNDHGPGIYWGACERIEYTQDELAARLGENPATLDRPQKMSEAEVDAARQKREEWANLNGPKIDRDRERQKLNPKI